MNICGYRLTKGRSACCAKTKNVRSQTDDNGNAKFESFSSKKKSFRKRAEDMLVPPNPPEKELKIFSCGRCGEKHGKKVRFFSCFWHTAVGGAFVFFSV